MHLVTRAQWGAKPPRYPLVVISSTKGVKIHYEGTPVPAEMDHSKCDDQVRAIQAAHLANAKEDYSDIAYNYVVCRHGSVYEGRGLHHKTGANGDQPLNIAHYAVCALLGSEGLTHPPDAMLSGLVDAVEYLREHGGAGDELRGHRDGYATDCPGDPLYAWVKAGGHRPESDPGTAAPPPPAPSFPGRQFFVLGASGPHALQLQKWLDKGKWGPAYKVGPSEHMTALDIQKVAALQHHFLAALGPADGLCGPVTWRYAYETAVGLRDR
jgi:hypothetical protein